MNNVGDGYESVTCESALPRTLSRSHVPSPLIRQMLASFFEVKFWRTISKWRKRKRKLSSCIPVIGNTCNKALSRCTRVQRGLRNVQKKRQSCCFANINRLCFFLPFSLPSPSSLLKLPILLPAFVAGLKRKGKGIWALLIVYNSFFEQAFSVEMPECWPRCFLRFYCPWLYSSWSIKPDFFV